MARAAPDPFTVEVIRHGLSSIAEEMSLVVMRAARSPLLREAGDLSSALTDANGALIAQGRDIPIHMGVMSSTIRELLKRVPLERFAPGDVWFLNLPEIGGNHLPDVKAIRPIYSGDRLVAFAISLAHWADIGGAVPGSYLASATDAWQEGLRLSPVRWFTADGPNRETLDLVLANVRGAAEREGDILAQVAATRAADERLGDLIGRFGVETLESAIDALIDQSARETAEALQALPDGVFEGEDWIDDDGTGSDPIAIRVRIERTGGRVRFDFSGSGDATRGPVNTTPFIAAAGVFYAVKAIFAPDVAPNEGCFRPLEIVTRPGSILNPPPDRPVVGGNHETAQRVADAIVKALEPVVPERLTAGGPTTSGLMLFGGRRDDGAWTTLYEVHGGGEGARAERDGMAAVRVHMSNVMNTPAEVIEAEYPIRVERQAIRRGSGGAGAHKGGDGLIRRYRIAGDEVALTTMFERRLIPPYGLAGGESGAPYRVIVERTGGERFEAPGKANMTLARGDRVTMESCGGGGYGSTAASEEGNS